MSHVAAQTGLGLQRSPTKSTWPWRLRKSKYGATFSMAQYSEAGVGIGMGCGEGFWYFEENVGVFVMFC